jgi:hypothetical protein
MSKSLLRSSLRDATSIYRIGAALPKDNPNRANIMSKMTNEINRLMLLLEKA